MQFGRKKRRKSLYIYIHEQSFITLFIYNSYFHHWPITHALQIRWKKISLDLEPSYL